MKNKSFDDGKKISKMLLNTKISKIISIITIVIGLLVTMGWIFDIPALKSIMPNEVTMKFSTAISFVFSGIILYFVSNHYAGKIGMDQIAIPISGLVIFLFMATILITNIVGVSNGVEQLFIKEDKSAVETKSPGMPSIPTAISFLLIIIVGIVSLTNSNRLRPISYMGYVIMAVGTVSLAGHMISQPLLYYYVENFSTAMAIHTSALFALIGFALCILKAPQKIIYSAIKIQTKLISLFLASSIIPIIFVFGLNFTIAQNSETSYNNSIIIISIVTAIAVSIFSIFTAKSISQPIITLKIYLQRFPRATLQSKLLKVPMMRLGNSPNHLIKWLTT